jgi:hypothetical protein
MSTHKTGRIPKIKFELFIKCRDLETATFWKNIFESCAYGKFPKGMTFKSGILYCKKAKRKAGANHIIPEEPEKALEILKSVLRSEIGLISMDEYTTSHMHLYQYFKESELSKEAKWRDIRAPTIRKHLIHGYVIELQHKLKLTHFEAEQLQSCITVGLLTETLVPEDITLDGENVKVTDIKHVKRNAVGFYIDRTVQVTLDGCKMVMASSQKAASLGWSNYVEKYNTHLKACNV